MSLAWPYRPTFSQLLLLYPYLQVSSSPFLISHLATNWIALQTKSFQFSKPLTHFIHPWPLWPLTCQDESWSLCSTHMSVTSGTHEGRGTLHVFQVRSRDPPHWSWGHHTRALHHCHSPNPDPGASWDHTFTNDVFNFIFTPITW